MPAAPPRILVIDDDEAMRDFIGDVLGNAGYDFELASTGQDGLSKFEHTAFQAVITDLWMPVTDGISTIVALRARDKNIPIVLITGVQKKEALVAVSTQVGANCILRKPFQIAVLLRILADLLALQRSDAV